MDHEHGMNGQSTDGNEFQARLLRRSRTSAMADGEASPAEAQGWLQDWPHDEAARRDWHLYHLIGDTLRSDELASTPERDEQLLQRVRQAVQHEERAVAFARAARPRIRLWTSSAAAVAGFALVAGAVLSNRVEGDFESPVLSWVPGGGASLQAPALGAPDGVQDLRRASVEVGPAAAGTGFREILRLPRGPASNPMESVQVLYSNGTATISMQMDPYRPGEHVPKSEVGERLNALSVQRDGVWLTLTGDVPLATLGQFAATIHRAP